MSSNGRSLQAWQTPSEAKAATGKEASGAVNVVPHVIEDSDSETSAEEHDVGVREAATKEQDESPETPGPRSASKSGSSTTSTSSVSEESVSHPIIDSRWFVVVVYTLIFANSLQMGLALDINNEKGYSADWDDFWKATEIFFTVSFTLEMIIKLIVLKGPRVYLANNWNRLDCFLVTMSLVDVVMDIAVSGGEDSPLRQLSILRTLRVLRVMRIARLLKVFKELWMIIKGILDSLQTMFWVSMLLLLILYVSAIFLVDVVGRSETLYPGFNNSTAGIHSQDEIQAFNNYMYFGTIPRSMYTLFCLSILLEFPEFARPVFEKQRHMIVFMLVFIIFTSFGIMNVIIGVIVDNTMEAAAGMQSEDQAKEKAAKLKQLSLIRDMVFGLDTDGNGMVSLDELEEGMKMEKVVEGFKLVNFPRGFSPSEIMALLDHDGDGQLQFSEFLWSFFRLIDNDTFQGSCMMHQSLNGLKGEASKLAEDSMRSFAAIDEYINEVEAAAKNTGVLK